MTAYNFALTNTDNAYPVRYEPGYLYFVEFEFSLSVAFVVNDTITTPAFSLPTSGIRIAEVEVLHSSLDTNVSPTLTYLVGDASATANGVTYTGVNNRFLVTAPGWSTVSGGQVKNNINQPQTVTNGIVTAGVNYLYGSSNGAIGPNTNGPQIVMTINGGPATGATTGYIRLKVWYWSTGEN